MRSHFNSGVLETDFVFISSFIARKTFISTAIPRITLFFTRVHKSQTILNGLSRVCSFSDIYLAIWLKNQCQRDFEAANLTRKIYKKISLPSPWQESKYHVFLFTFPGYDFFPCLFSDSTFFLLSQKRSVFLSLLRSDLSPPPRYHFVPFSSADTAFFPSLSQIPYLIFFLPRYHLFSFPTRGHRFSSTHTFVIFFPSPLFSYNGGMGHIIGWKETFPGDVVLRYLWCSSDRNLNVLIFAFPFKKKKSVFEQINFWSTLFILFERYIF